jgi:hypothetical protein
MNTNYREYFPESEINRGDLLAHLDDESVAFFGISATGERWFVRKRMPQIYGTPETNIQWEGISRDEGMVEAETDDFEAESAELRAAAIERIRNWGQSDE